MFCQKCRTPLKLDSSLEDLNPAAFDLLVASASKAVPEQTPSPNPSYPPERKDLYDRTSATSTSPIFKRSIPGPRHGKAVELSPYSQARLGSKNTPDMSFIEVTHSQIVPSQNSPEESRMARGSHQPAIKKIENENSDHTIPLSYEIERSQRLFAILSAHSDIDHPVCAECTSLLLAQLSSRLASSTRERDAYISFLKSLQSSSSTIPSSEATQTAEQALAETLEKEKASLEELKALEREKKTLEGEIAELEEQGRALELEEQTFWALRNSFDETVHDLSTDLSSLQKKQLHDEQQFERLRRTNVFNDTFNIGHDGFFGTINGLRLGRLPNQNVEWSEINAAWGQTLLLLVTVAERLGYTFQGYRLRPMGSTSRIEKVEWPQQLPDANFHSRSNEGASLLRPTQPPTTTVTPKVTPLDLFSSGDIPLGRVFYHRRFDAGMVAFLDCLSQLGTFVEKTSPSTGDRRPTPTRTASSRSAASRGRVLPYPINGDKIGDVLTGQAVSIKLGAGFNQDESWTKACKYALTCCKYLLAYVSDMDVRKDVRA